jgi:hypothetical protein
MKIEELLARPEGKTLEFKLDLSSRSLVSRISGNIKHWSLVICDW